MVEKVTHLRNQDTSEKTQQFCKEILALLPLLNNNEKIPYLALGDFFDKHAYPTMAFYEAQILLRTPDPKILRTLDAFPRIFLYPKIA